MSTSAKDLELILRKKTFVFDLDGTLYLGGKVLPGAIDLVRELRARDKQILFLTNNSSRSAGDYLKKLKAMGFGARKDEILMSTHILIDYLKAKKFRRVYLLGTPAMRRMLSQAGIRCVQSKPQAVVVGFDKTLTYERLLKSARWIDQGLPYIVTHPDYFCPTEKGPEPDCGAMAKLLELSTKRKPLVVLGKPHPAVMKVASARTKSPKSQMILFGDRLATDIEMARKSGIDAVFVLSGDNTRADLKKARLKPRWVLPSVRALAEALKRL